ncbi:MAG: VOC family protein [Thermoanaerobaculia bacterium]
MTFRVERLDHVELFVRDLEAAVSWYRRVLGLEEIRRWDPHPVMIGRGGTMLALFRDRGDEEPRAPALGNFRRVAWLTDGAGFEAAQSHLKELGVAFDGPIDHDGPRSIYFVDPDGHPLEITTYP